MALSIKDEETDRLARRYARIKGTSCTGAIRLALREAIAREEGNSEGDAFMANLRRIQDRVAKLPILDPRTPDEILGYDDQGLPT